MIGHDSRYSAAQGAFKNYALWDNRRSEDEDSVPWLMTFNLPYLGLLNVSDCEAEESLFVTDGETALIFRIANKCNYKGYFKMVVK